MSTEHPVNSKEVVPNDTERLADQEPKIFGGILDLVDTDGKILGKKIAQERGKLAQQLHETRQKRDSYLKESKKLSNVVMGFFNEEKSPNTLQRKADAESYNARQFLRTEGSHIESMEGRYAIEEIWEKTVKHPLDNLAALKFKESTVSYDEIKGGTKEFDEEFYERSFADFNQKNASILFSSPEFCHLALRSFNNYLAYTSRVGKTQLPKRDEVVASIKDAVLKTPSSLDCSKRKDENARYALELFNELLPTLTETELDVLIPFVEKNVYDIDPVDQLGRFWDSDLVSKLMVRGSPETREKITKDIDRKFERGTPHGIAHALVLKCEELRPYSQNKLNEYLKRNLNISCEDIQDGWDFEGSPGQVYLENDIACNLEAMQALESKRKGSVSELVHKYGIQEFQRYPEEMLLAQLEEEDTQQPYGVVVYPRDDWNGAFDADKKLWKDFFGETRSRCGLKIFECASRIDIARHLLDLDKKYGAEHKISFAVIAGHGQENKIQFGPWWGHFSALSKVDIGSGKGIRRVKDFFVEDPSIVFFSCSTGAEEGIAQELSQTLGAEVMAPNKPTHPNKLSITFDTQKKPKLGVEYSGKSTQTMAYNMGRNESVKNDY